MDLKFVFGAKDGVRFEVVDVADGPVGANKGQRVVVVLDVAAIDKNPFSFDFSRKKYSTFSFKVFQSLQQHHYFLKIWANPDIFFSLFLVFSKKH